MVAALLCSLSAAMVLQSTGYHFALAKTEELPLDAYHFSVQPLRDDIYLVATPERNITVQVGPNGSLLVDSKFRPADDQIRTIIQNIWSKPVRYIVATHLERFPGNSRVLPSGLALFGHVLMRKEDLPEAEGDEFSKRFYVGNNSEASNSQGAQDGFVPGEELMFFNGEDIRIVHQRLDAAADDNIVVFLKADVISTGRLFRPDAYPTIDVPNGGSIDRVIDTLDRIVDLGVARHHESGTLIVPDSGEVCDVAEIVFYRNALSVIRSRIEEMVQKGMPLDQVKAAKPTSQFDRFYSSPDTAATTGAFIEAVFDNAVRRRATNQP